MRVFFYSSFRKRSTPMLIAECLPTFKERLGDAARKCGAAICITGAGFGLFCKGCRLLGGIFSFCVLVLRVP